nr:hypothetical protein [Neobacillus sp. Marseille-Q6967]
MIDRILLKELQEYIELHLNPVTFSVYRSEDMIERNISEEVYSAEMKNFIKKNRKPSFKELLFRFIDEKGASDADIYKKAGMDRRHFSKIRSNKDYRPGKNTTIALALALELDLMEADELLGSAGYTLSDSETFDLVIQFCLEKKIYKLGEVNQALDYFSLRPLIGVIK